MADHSKSIEMKIRNYLIIKTGEALLVILILLLCLSFNARGQVKTSSTFSTEMKLQQKTEFSILRTSTTDSSIINPTK
jgi:hypothetical protein